MTTFYPTDMQAFIYNIVQTVANRLVVTSPLDIVAWAEANGRSAYWPTRNLHLRPELQLQPRITGLVGPLWDGEQGGTPVIRYEDDATYDFLSR
jgi:hypothetical protein